MKILWSLVRHRRRFTELMVVVVVLRLWEFSKYEKKKKGVCRNVDKEIKEEFSSKVKKKKTQ